MPAPAVTWPRSAPRSSASGRRSSIANISGGICLNWGCIPTKALLRSAEIFHYFEHAKDFGLSAKDVSFDMEAVVKRSRGVSGRLNGGVGMLLKKNKVDVIWGEGSIEAPGKVTVKKATKSVEGPPKEAPKGALGPGSYSAKNIIVATGARPRVLPGIEPDKDLILDLFRGDGAQDHAEIRAGDGLRRHRHRIRLVLSHHGCRGDGGRAAAADPACRGCRDRSSCAQALSRSRGIRILTGAKVSKVEKGKGSVTATIEDDKGKQTITAEKLISAVGVVGNIENLGLEKLGVKTDRGCVVTERAGPHQRAGHLRHRRCRRPAHAGPQGRA